MSPAVSVQHISKRFGAVAALQDVSVEFYPGEVHAVVGENGAGKSTLMAALAGFVRPDAGTIHVGAEKLPLGDPHAARKVGIAMVHQHFMLVPEFSVEENLALAELEGAGWSIRASELAGKALRTGEAIGWRFDAKARTSTLSVGQQQRLEILKALASGGEVLILDEPTAVLRHDEVEELFRVLRDLQAQGKAILLVAHKLSEVLAISNRVTVLRKGGLVRTAPRTEVDAPKLAEWMLGERPPLPESLSMAKGPVAMRAVDLRISGDRGELRVDHVNLEVCEGEILGIGGVDGNGQVELAEALAGVRDFEGVIEGGGRVGFIPPDRHRDGLALEMTVEENLLIEGHRRFGAVLPKAAIRGWAEGIRNRFDIAAPQLVNPVRGLSGGNQQKVVVGRTLDAQPKVLVAVNPTRGLDVRAAAFVRHQIRETAAGGAAVVLFSTDLDELHEIASRQLYMSGGKLLAPEAEAYLGGAS